MHCLKSSLQPPPPRQYAEKKKRIQTLRLNLDCPYNERRDKELCTALSPVLKVMTIKIHPCASAEGIYLPKRVEECIQETVRSFNLDMKKRKEKERKKERSVALFLRK